MAEEYNPVYTRLLCWDGQQCTTRVLEREVRVSWHFASTHVYSSWALCDCSEQSCL